MEGEKQDSSMTINFLPKDVLLEILARLPVKSILRFRTVSKYWRDIPKDQSFITKHHLTQIALNHGNILFTRALMNSKYDFYLLTEDELGIKSTCLELPFFKDSGEEHLEVAGPCNGIFIINDGYDGLFLWNPATREYKALPAGTSLPRSFPSKSKPEIPFERLRSRVGFGMDPITKDYKVVRIWGYSVAPDVYFCKGEVLSLSGNSCKPKDKSWRRSDTVPPIFCYESDQMYLNGKYYWCNEIPTGWGIRECKILWFDMGAEVFGVIELPTLCSDSYVNKLAVFNESIAMIRHAYMIENKYMYEIWVMNGCDGVSWTKYATVGPFVLGEVPFGFWKNEEELVVENCQCDLDDDYDYTLDLPTTEITSYNIKNSVTKKIMKYVRLDECLPLAIYNESLFSVRGED